MESFEELAKAQNQSADDTREERKDASPPQPSLADVSAPSGPSQNTTVHGPTAEVQASTTSALPGDTVPPLDPPLSNSRPDDSKRGETAADEEEERSQLTASFHEAELPQGQVHRKLQHGSSEDGDSVLRLRKFTLYESTNYFYILGSDLQDRNFQIMKIDRNADPGELNITEDGTLYTKKEVYLLLKAIDEGYKSTGGLKQKMTFWGLLGFIRFTGPYYMLVISKRTQVAMLGGHYIYQIDGTELISITSQSYNKSRPDRNPEEIRFLNILNSLDLKRAFYFSHSYDVTRTLQFNIIREREALNQGRNESEHWDQNDMFVWNHHLLETARAVLKNPFDWCLSIIHGYVDQSALSIYWGRVVYVTIIARRSRFFAGARYLKRGANDLGHVANDVETEQIVSEMLTTSFHAPGPVLFANPHYTSYVQHRGSIPLHWSQDTSGVQPKPGINVTVVDPFFSVAALHFDNLFERYGTPIYVLNLIKSRERMPRESKLLDEYTIAIRYLNQFLPEDKRIIHHHWDMSRAAKTRGHDVIGDLAEIAKGILPKTGFFRNGNGTESGLQLQNGVARTNCIDCLDRTNAAQFVIGKEALGYQLQALGVIEDAVINFDSDALNLFTHMWHDHGNTIAIQYGGSHLVNTMQTYQKINQWQSQSRDMVETFKRFYNNSFLDAQRQEAYNLFLGNYTFSEDEPLLWDLSTDYYLHHNDPRAMFGKQRPSYREWFTASHLIPPQLPLSTSDADNCQFPLEDFDDYWTEYYRPSTLSSFKKLFASKMHSNLRYIPFKSMQDGKYDLSPFRVRTNHDNDTADGKRGNTDSVRRKGVKIIAPSDTASIASANVISPRDTQINSPNVEFGTLSGERPPLAGSQPQFNTLGQWLDAQQQIHASHQSNDRDSSKTYTGIIKEPSFEVPGIGYHHLKVPSFPLPGASNEPPTKAEKALEAFTEMVSQTIEPRVTSAEMREYEKYVTHPLNLPLVYGNSGNDKGPPSSYNFETRQRPTSGVKAPFEFLEYVAKIDDSLLRDHNSKLPPPEHHTEDFRGSSTSLASLATLTAAASPSIGVGGATAPGMRPIATLDERAMQNLDVYTEFLDFWPTEALTVLEEDGDKKRYKRYRQWLKGKSLFKQRPLVGGDAGEAVQF